MGGWEGKEEAARATPSGATCACSPHFYEQFMSRLSTIYGSAYSIVFG
jgi:hypothetical protein